MRHQISEDLYGRDAVQKAKRKLRDGGIRIKRFTPLMRAARRFPGPVDNNIGDELKEKVMQVAGSMSARLQDVVRCRIFEGMTNDETCKELGMSRKSASNAMSVVRMKLSEEVRWVWPDDLSRSA
jgi:DNA-directed RNA polymerase specialized sigma24 family protein